MENIKKKKEKKQAYTEKRIYILSLKNRKTDKIIPIR
jgi:hypothetical protein